MITTSAIIQSVCEYYGVTKGELTGNRRHRRIAVPRMIAMYLCRHIRPEFSLPHIGRHFGDKDHTTVLSAKRRIAFLIATNETIASQVGELRRLVAGHVFTPQHAPKPICGPVKPFRHPTDDEEGRPPQPLLYLAATRPEPVIARTEYRPILIPSELRPISKAAMMGQRAS